MFSLLTHTFPKTHTATTNPLITENGHNKIYFSPKAPTTATVTTPWAMRNITKPGPTLSTPPYHWHLRQDETFLVLRGRMLATIEGVDRVVGAGEKVTIVAGQYHTFCNADAAADVKEKESGGGQNLKVSIGLDPADRERDEAFFRNLYSYLDDCERHGVAPQLPQLCLFLWFSNVISPGRGQRFS